MSERRRAAVGASPDSPDPTAAADPEHLRERATVLRAADAELRAAIAGLDPAVVRGPSRLPDWSVGHVLSHLSRNADGLGNLLQWAATGIETPMYASTQARDADVEAGARRDPAEILDDYVVSSDRFLTAVDTLPAAAWSTQVRTRTGGPIPAAVVLDHRICELFLHHHDLGIDGGLTELTNQQATALLSGLQRTYVRTHDVPAIALLPIDGDRIDIGPVAADPATADPATADPVTVTGTAAALAGWLTGRTDGAELIFDGPRPTLPSW
ncbi:maleylpyruvate isomerase family mycothiol-dependent enzyme [Nakamurella lactea]|uniref:maleylpyruvate isomerase family mycothiol-dependent enzyme n=1 Tax=Nakamurella lactea TaxID=459515 RepID=UPI00040872A6|nr:maleylpyruvate isomerase family mycothiol-dependent enzyme [Nakamurella lactea]